MLCFEIPLATELIAAMPCAFIPRESFGVHVFRHALNLRIIEVVAAGRSRPICEIARFVEDLIQLSKGVLRTVCCLALIVCP